MRIKMIISMWDKFYLSFSLLNRSEIILIIAVVILHKLSKFREKAAMKRFRNMRCIRLVDHDEVQLSSVHSAT